MNREIIRKLQFLAMLALLLYPVCALVLGYGGMLQWRWMLPCMMFVFSALAMPVPGKFRLSLGAAGGAAMVLFALFLFNRGADWKIWLLCGGCAAVLLWSMKIGGWKPEREMPMFWVAAGVASQLAVRVAMLVMENTQGKTLPTIQWEITLAFLCFVILGMCSMNRSALNSASMGRTHASGSMRRKNTLMILALFAVALLISMLPALVALAEWVADMLGKLVMWFTSLFGGDELSALPPEEQQMDNNEQMEFPPWVILAGKIVGFALVAFIASQVFLGMKELVKSVLDRLNSFSSDAGEDFVDEVSDIREEEDRQMQTRRLRRSDERELDNLEPRQQIRRQYRRLLRIHKDWGDARTARETIPDEMAKLYERARYSGGTVTEEDAKIFRSGTKKL